MPIKIKILHADAIVPSYQTQGASGFDFHALKATTIKPQERQIIATGLAFEIPLGYELQVRPRSGLALKKGISIVNAPGTVDSDYRGEVKIILINHSQETFEIQAGDRIAQGVICPIIQAEFILSDDLENTQRQDKGFGSTNS